MNTDYYQAWNVIIEKFPDKIVMANPGTIIPGKEQMLRGGISQPRNKVLFKMFNMIGVGEHAGSGVPDIFDVWETEGLLEPTIEEQFGAKVPDRTILTLPLVVQNQALSGKGPEKGPKKGPEEKIITKNEEINKRKNEIIATIKKNPTISRAQISHELGISDKQIRVALDDLKKNGYIHINKEPTKQLILTTCSPNKEGYQLVINSIKKES